MAHQKEIEDIKLNIGISEDNKQFHLFEEIVYKLRDVAENRKKCLKLYMKLGRRHDIKVSKINLLSVYKIMINNGKIDYKIDLMMFLQKKPIRNLSGIAIITVLLSPYPEKEDGTKQEFSCEENCYYCPNHPEYARSYVPGEPATMRGIANGWSPKKQMISRMDSLYKQGHKINKIELIIEGGTFTQYPRSYLERFIRDLYYCANVYFSKENRAPHTITGEMEINNEESLCKITGLCIETRPTISDDWYMFMRHIGVTKIQIGVQHTDDKILKKINRGHTFKEAEEGVIKTKDNCFKDCIHTMPDLPNSNPEKDKEMFDILFKESKMFPDEMKIYPCETTPYTVIKKWFDEGKYMPYANTNPEALLDVIVHAMTLCPRWCRLVRVIRDIPTTYIEAGNVVPNLRQIAEERINQLGLTTNDIRFREIGRNASQLPTNYFVEKYSDEDWFVSCETIDRKALIGFIRLRIPDPDRHNPTFGVLRQRGLIRELHVYGEQKETHDKTENKYSEKQHKGIGKTLVKMAENIAFNNNCIGTAVISGEGVRNYYRTKLGYHYSDTFEIKNFKYTQIDLIIFTMSLIVTVMAVILYWITNYR